MKVRGLWWKLLGVLLILYSLLAGLIIPLGSGVVAVDPMVARAGSPLELRVEGYNSHFDSEGQRAWLRLNATAVIEAKQLQASDRRHLAATFQIPSSLPGRDTINSANLILYNPVDGHSVLPSAIVIRGNAMEGSAAWNDDLLEASGATGFHFPFRNILKETIRNTYFHVQIWFALLFICLISAINSVRFLRSKKPLFDYKAEAFAATGLVWACLGMCTGILWAGNTWGSYWSFDVKQNMTAIAILMYLAYFILRQSIADKDVARRFSAAYNIFAFLMLIPLLYIIPRMTDSLHPGSGGNPAMGSEDMDNRMRMVFYPAIIGWTLLGMWISNVYWRHLLLKSHFEEEFE